MKALYVSVMMAGWDAGNGEARKKKDRRTDFVGRARSWMNLSSRKRKSQKILPLSLLLFSLYQFRLFFSDLHKLLPSVAVLSCFFLHAFLHNLQDPMPVYLPVYLFLFFMTPEEKDTKHSTASIIILLLLQENLSYLWRMERLSPSTIAKREEKNFLIDLLWSISPERRLFFIIRRHEEEKTTDELRENKSRRRDRNEKGVSDWRGPFWMKIPQVKRKREKERLD